MRVLVCVAFLASAACSGSEYPKCTSDDQCRRATSGKGVDEHCLLGKCQACARDEHCAASETCNRGRCDARAAAAAPLPAAAPVAVAPETAPCSTRETVAFDFNTAELTPAAQQTLAALARCQAGKASLSLTIEGHCDERGTTEYNLALGARRAEAIRDHLARLGVAREAIKTISYGKERPVDGGSGEAAWMKNRRGELTVVR